MDNLFDASLNTVPATATTVSKRLTGRSDEMALEQAVKHLVSYQPRTYQEKADINARSDSEANWFILGFLARTIKCASGMCICRAWRVYSSAVRIDGWIGIISLAAQL